MFFHQAMFQPNCPVGLTQLFATSVTARLPRGRVYVVLYMQRMHGARRLLRAIIWLHAGEGIWSEGGGKMKAKINEVSGIFLLPEHWPAQQRLPKTHILECVWVHEDLRFELKFEFN